MPRNATYDALRKQIEQFQADLFYGRLRPGERRTRAEAIRGKVEAAYWARLLTRSLAQDLLTSIMLVQIECDI